MSISAASVSAALRRGGLRPLPSGTSRMREGLRVSRSWQSVRVTADLNSNRDAIEMAKWAAEILTAAGYVLDAEQDQTGFNVTERTPTEETA